MTVEKPTMNEDVSSVKNGDVPASHVTSGGVHGRVDGVDVDWGKDCYGYCSKLYIEHRTIISL